MAFLLDFVDERQCFGESNSQVNIIFKFTNARINDGHRLQDIGVLVVLKIQGVGNARIGAELGDFGFPNVQFVVIGNRLAFGHQEDCMLIDRLSVADGEYGSCDRQWRTILPGVVPDSSAAPAHRHPVRPLPGAASCPCMPVRLRRHSSALRFSASKSGCGRSILLKIIQDFDFVRIFVFQPVGKILVLEVRE